MTFIDVAVWILFAIVFVDVGLRFWIAHLKRRLAKLRSTVADFDSRREGGP